MDMDIAHYSVTNGTHSHVRSHCLPVITGANHGLLAERIWHFPSVKLDARVHDAHAV